MLSLLRRVSTTRASYQARTMSSVAPEFKQFRLALIQQGPSHVPENPTPADIKLANLKHAKDLISRAVQNTNGKPDLVVLPVWPPSRFYSTLLHD